MKILKYFSITFLSIILIFLALFLFSQTSFYKRYLQDKYISSWAQILSGIDTPSALKKIKQQDIRDQIIVRNFKDGSWIAGVCQGFVFEGWSAIVIKDSSGKIYASREVISGGEVLYNQFQDKKVLKSQDFYGMFSSYNFEEIKL